MTTEFIFIGWNTEGSSDKVWGYFLRPTETPIKGKINYWYKPSKEQGWNCCVFWGRRGKAMQFKADVTGYKLNNLKLSKIKKGYVEIDEKKLLEIWPTFMDEMQLKLSFEVLAGKVK